MLEPLFLLGTTVAISLSGVMMLDLRYEISHI